MDTMLIQCICIFFGLNSISSIVADSESSVNEATNSSQLNFESSRFKPKSDFDDFNFDGSIFDGASSFDDKNEDKVNPFNGDEDIDSIIPSSSFKITRSNSQTLGTYGENLDSSNFPSFKPGSTSQLVQRSSESQGDVLSNENEDASGQARPTNTVSIPYFDSFVTHPKQVKSSTFQNDNTYEIPMKARFSAYPPVEFTSGIPTYSPLTQAPIQAVASSHHNQAQKFASQHIPYKTQSTPGLQLSYPLSNINAPLYLHNQEPRQYGAQFQNFGHNPFEASASDKNGKKMAPPILHLQSSPSFRNYNQPLETNPVIFNAGNGLQYKAQPSYGTNFDHAKFKHGNQRSAITTPFLSAQNPRSTQILPVHAATSTAKFPKYKGASIAQFPTKGYSKIPDEYQDFQLQPQLHFDGNKNNKNRNYQIPANKFKPFEQIRADVEIIDKKKPIPPLPRDDDGGGKSSDDDSGEDYDNSGNSRPKSDEDDTEKSPEKPFRETELKSGFKASESFPFKEYDEKFGKHKKISTNKDDNNGPKEVGVNLAAKYRYFDKSNEEGGKGKESAEDVSHSKFESYPLRYRYEGHSNENDDGKEETQRQEKRERSKHANQHGIKKPKARKNTGKNYEEDFEQNFKEKQKKPNFSSYHSQESDESSESQTHARPNYRKGESPSISLKKNQHRFYRDETGEPLNPITALNSSSDFLGVKGFNKNPKKLKEIKSLHAPWSDFYEPKATNVESLGVALSNFKEEAGDPNVAVTDNYKKMRKPIVVPQQYSSRPSYKTAIAAPKGASILNGAEPGITAYIPRQDWKSSDRKVKPALGDTYIRPLNPGLTLAHAGPSSVNLDSGRAEILRSLKGI